MSYLSTYQSWREDPCQFWARAAADVHWHKPWDQVLDDSTPPFYRWFKGGMVNNCYSALDHHVANGRADQKALIYDSPVTDQVQTYTYRELLNETARFAGVMHGLGVTRGDRVIIYMPMIPQTVIAILACARIGAVHSVVFGGFAPKELATRIDDAKPVLIVSASCGIEIKRVIPYKPLLDRAIDLAEHQPNHCIIYQRPQLEAPLIPQRDHLWSHLMQGAQPVPCTWVDATDPLYILYTSGTTGIPKGVVRDNGGHLVALKWSMAHIYGAHPGDVYWAASDVGWVVGHSYIVYGPLFSGCTTVLYEGKPVGTPDPGAFWRVIEQHGVSTLFTAPTAFRAIKREDSTAKHLDKHDISSLRALFLAGERCDPDTLAWAEQHLGVPVIDHWWQTETGWPIAANCLGIELLKVKPGSSAKPVPGYDVRIVDDAGSEQPAGKIGNIVVRLPMPPGCLPTLWHNDAGYQQAYMQPFPGYYHTADAGYLDEDGYLFIMSRTDDIINVAGHRLSTGGMEEVLSGHPDVAENAVFGVKDHLKGEVPLGLLVLNAEVSRSTDEILAEVVALVRQKIGPVASFKQAAVVKRLPKTRSGKVLRGTMKKIADGSSWHMPATIDDPTILDEIAQSLKELGYPRQ